MSEISTLPILEFTSSELFQSWMEANHDNSTGLWLRIFKKGSNIKTMSYAEALDICLCFGWIDAQRKSYDTQSWIQKLCPRTTKSIWSKVNIGHVERLIKAHKMQPSGFQAIEKAKADGRWERAYDSPSNMVIPEDFLALLRKNSKAQEFYKTLNKSSLYSIGFRLQTAIKTETREKHIKEIIEKLAKSEKLQ
jgi:uncharacterized protein YdeI (YjbR/CyaY-like superfamily)